MIVQFVRGSLLTKDKLYNRFHRADARHEISCRQYYLVIGEDVHSIHTIESRLSIVKAYEWHG